MVSLLKTALLLEAITHILSLCPKPVTYKAWKAQALIYEKIKLEKKAIHHSFSAFSSKPHNPQNYSPPHPNPIKTDTSIRWDGTEITYIGAGQPIDVFIGQARCKGAYYLCGKTGHFARECPNQKAQIRAVLRAMTGKERQVWVDEVRELDESSTKEEQPAEEAPLEEDFTEAQA